MKRQGGLAGTIQVFDDVHAVAEAAIEHILATAEAAIRRRGLFTLVLAGGRTPLSLYRRLSEMKLDFSRWRFFFGDERCLPERHEDRNSRAVDEAWFEPSGVSRAHIHPIPAELGPEEAAEIYAATIGDWQPFDLVLLGMGEDGHVASLFPGHEHGTDCLVVPVHHAPKPPLDRVSLNYKTLASAQKRLLLVTGAGKAEAVRSWFEGADLPVARLTSQAVMNVFMDEAAASLVSIT
jgi:6-phosphogluconolactonase